MKTPVLKTPRILGLGPMQFAIQLIQFNSKGTITLKHPSQVGATKTVEIVLCGNFLSVRSFLIEKMIKFHPHGSRKKARLLKRHYY